jgi:hypothetical protein
VKSSNLVKIAAAFLIGVVVTLGSALLYFRTTDIPPEKPSHTAATAPEPNPAPEPESTPAITADPPVHTQDKPLPKITVEAKPKSARPVPSREPKKQPITVLAQSYPLPSTSPTPTPAPMTTPSPGVNEPASPSSLPNSPAVESNAPPPDPVPEPHVVTLQAGTNLAIRLGETLSSDHNYTGDTFRGTLESPVIVDGFIIAEKGSKVLGKVITAQEAGRVQGLSGLTLALTEINTTDGQRVRVQTDSYEKRGSSSSGTDAATIAGGAALGAIIGAIAGGGKGAVIGAGAGGAAGTGVILATRGRPTALPVETHLNFRLSAPVTITEQIHN